MISWLKKFFMAFIFAGRGIKFATKERNIRFHLFTTILVLLLSVYLKISTLEWFIVLILIGIVISLEMINTSLEELANILRDKLNLEYSATTRARDVSAGAVLVVSIISAIIGLIIFIPKIF